MSKRRKKQKRRTNTQQRLAIFAIISGVVLLLVVGGLTLLDARQPATADVAEIPDYHDEQGVPYPETPRIAVTDAKALYDAGSAIFVDVRSQGEYETAHVANAISLPLADLEARYKELPKDAAIITYCT